MAADGTLSDEAIDAYLAEPDCPQCGSEDVVCTGARPDGTGGVWRTWACNRCGYVWTDHVARA